MACGEPEVEAGARARLTLFRSPTRRGTPMGILPTASNNGAKVVKCT